MKRSTKIAGLTLVMAIVMAWTATAAQANIEWIVEGKAIPEGVHHKVECTLPINEFLETEPLLIESEIFGVELEFEFDEAACEEWFIWNTKGEAFSSGRLKLGKGTVNVPNCTVEQAGKGAGTVTSEPLSGHVGKFAALETELGITYKSTTGNDMAIIHVVGAGCAIKGNYALEGMDVAEVPPLNELTPNPIPFDFSLEIEELIGERLDLVEEPASIEGGLDFYL
jgi:hypothetical protein